MDQFLLVAKQQALKSNMDHKHGSVIVYKNKIIAKGYNHHVNYYNHKHSMHAEIDAITKIKKIPIDFSMCDMYVVRVSNESDAILKLSKPCKNCVKTILEFGIKRVYYST